MLNELFPTISLGDGLNYSQIMMHISNLKNELNQGLAKCKSAKHNLSISTSISSGDLIDSGRHKISKLEDIKELPGIVEDSVNNISVMQ